MSKSDLVDIEMVWGGETDKAIRVKQHEDADDMWLPKSQVEFERRGQSLVVVTLPEWLANKRGLI